MNHTDRRGGFDGRAAQWLLIAWIALVASTPVAAETPCTKDPAPGDTGSAPQRIYGSVTNLAPLCVNGFEIAWPAESRIMRDGRSSPREALGLGHVVRIETNGAFPLVAKRIDIDVILGGPIHKVDVAAGKLTVMRTEVRVPKDALILGVDGSHQRLHELLPRDHVEVNGLWTDADDILASRIEVRPSGSPQHITATAVPVGRNTIYVHKARGRTSDAMGFDPDLRDKRVQLRGHWNERRQQFDEAFTRPRPIVSSNTRSLSIEGIATADPSGTKLGLSGSQDRWFVNGTGSELRVRLGSRMIVTAMRSETGDWVGKSFTAVETAADGSELRLAPVRGETN